MLPNWPAVIERLKLHPTEAAVKDYFRNYKMELGVFILRDGRYGRNSKVALGSETFTFVGSSRSTINCSDGMNTNNMDKLMLTTASPRLSEEGSIARLFLVSHGGVEPSD
jgi:hypothetical protein